MHEVETDQKESLLLVSIKYSHAIKSANA